MNSYYSQWSSQELLSMQGVEEDEKEDNDTDLCQEDCDTNSSQDECPYCHNGCNYCL